MSVFTYIVINVNLVGDQHTGNVLTMLTQLLVPVGQVLVGDLTGHVKHQDAAMGPVIIRRMHAIERLLTSRIPEV